MVRFLAGSLKKSALVARGTALKKSTFVARGTAESIMLGLMHPRLLAASALASTSLFACYAHATSAPPTSGTAVVVGVSHTPGIGSAVAKRFAEGGMRVGIIGRQPARLEEVKAEILKAVPDADIVCAPCDATDPAAVKQAFQSLKAQQGAPSALIYNLSCRPFPPTEVSSIEPARLEADWRTGPLGGLLCVQEVLPAMREQAEGTIIFTGASASLRGSKRFGSFAVAKTGLRALAQSLCKEEGPNGVHVSHVVVDGLVDMPVIQQFFPDAPTGRKLDPAAVAECYWQLHTQDKRCYAFEVDIRPHMADW